MKHRERSVIELLHSIAPPDVGPVVLSPEYLDAVRRVERHPDNEDRADKTWVGVTLRRNRKHFERATRRDP